MIGIILTPAKMTMGTILGLFRCHQSKVDKYSLVKSAKRQPPWESRISAVVLCFAVRAGETGYRVMEVSVK